MALSANPSRPLFALTSRPFFRLNAIVDLDVAAAAGWAPLDLMTAYLTGGARFLQLRAKSLPGGPFLELASRLVELSRTAGAALIVNDRADIARLAGAAGVHLGQDDVPPASARALLGPDAVIGFSTHTEAQLDAAIAQPVSYVAVGPVFGTSTKATGYTAVGLARVRYAAEKVQQMLDPDIVRHEAVGSGGSRTISGVVAIGGITLDNARSVIEAGAASVAVITDLLATKDPEARVRAYLARLAE